MHPERRREAEFDPERQPDDDRAEQQDNAHRGPVAGVMRAQVEAAYLAMIAHVQQIAEQPPPAAARTAAGQSHMQERRRRLRHRGQCAARTGLAAHQ